MSFWIKLMVVHYLICLNRRVQKPESYSWQLASANAAWIIALTIAAGIFIIFIPTPCWMRDSVVVFHSQPMLLRSVCISACSADQWAAFRLFFCERCEWHPSLFTNFFQWSPEWKKLRMSKNLKECHALRASFHEKHFKLFHQSFQVVVLRVECLLQTHRLKDQQINCSNLALLRIISKPQHRLPGFWELDRENYGCTVFIYTYTYIRIHIRDKDTYQRERGERGS